jgi:hypothetical protein
MKRILSLVFLLSIVIAGYSEDIVSTVDGRKIILFDDHTWKEIKNDTKEKVDIVLQYKDKLRKNIKATDIEIKTACEMLSDGWVYTMPKPKSAKAAWGISDGRTTWWYGFWYNEKTQLYSDSTPLKKSSGIYLGDNQNNSGSWKNGGSPKTPDIFMYLLSDSGGPNF